MVTTFAGNSGRLARSLLRCGAVSRLRVSIYIARSPRVVYEFAATPRNWSRWHPGSVTVSGAVDEPPAVGEQLIEKIALDGRRATRIAWKVIAHTPPEHWGLAARVPRRGLAELKFHLARNGRGTLCECHIAYEGRNPVVDAFVVRPRVLLEAKRSLARLKQVLETA